MPRMLVREFRASVPFAPLATCALLLTVLLSLVPPARARAAAPPSPCDRPECRQFDFWVGDWEVRTPDGKPAGSSRIERILDGCVVLENWKGAGGPEGKSFNIWTRRDSLWHQTWVSAVGGMLSLSGTFHDGVMVLEGGASGGQTADTRNRITWTPRPDGSVSQQWDSSSDGGKTWSVVFLGIYRKQPPGAK